MNYYFEVFKKYADFKGRARRKEYWMFMLFHIIIMYALLFGMMAAPSLMYLFLIYVFGSLVPSWAVTVRRMHDTGKSGWYMFIPIYSFILTCTNGEEGKTSTETTRKSRRCHRRNWHTGIILTTKHKNAPNELGLFLLSPDGLVQDVIHNSSG
jgi:uncharacterized membrane protein YhaH (DUF805 family)